MLSLWGSNGHLLLKKNRNATMTQLRQNFMSQFLYTLLVSVFIFSLSGCAGNKQRTPTDEEIAAALAQEKVEKQREIEKQRTEEKKRQEMAKSEIDMAMKEPPVDLNKFDYETYFGNLIVNRRESLRPERIM